MNLAVFRKCSKCGGTYKLSTTPARLYCSKECESVWYTKQYYVMSAPWRE